MSNRWLVVPVICLVAAAPAAAQEDLAARSGISVGLAVHLGTTDGRLEAALARGGRMLVQGLAADEAAVAAARQTLEREQVYGLASVVLARVGKRLPYRDHLVDLLVVSDWEHWGKRGLTEEEALRVVVPNGVAWFQRQGAWVKIVKPRPKEMDDWRSRRN